MCVNYILIIKLAINRKQVLWTQFNPMLTNYTI